jgi:hypothetical protein
MFHSNVDSKITISGKKKLLKFLERAGSSSAGSEFKEK